MTIVPLTLYLINYGFGKSTGINFVDSTPIEVCDNHRIYSHKVFKGLAQRGKSSTGWFYGFKLHLVINDKGEILSFCLTSGNKSLIIYKGVLFLLIFNYANGKVAKLNFINNRGCA